MVSGSRPAPAPGGWAAAPERSNALALRVMSWLAVTFGRRLARTVLHPITLYFMLFAPGVRRQSTRYLRRALGREPRFADGYRQIHAFASTILDRVYLLQDRLQGFEVAVQGAGVVEQAVAGQRGAFLVGAHMGSFEILRAAGETHALRVAMAMFPDNARMVNRALRAIAPGAGPKIIALGRADSMLAVRDWLAAGGLIGLLADRTLGVPSPREGELRMPFLGREACFPTGPFRLAAMLRQRVIFMAGVYLGGSRYDVRFEVLADFSERMDAAARERGIEDAVRSYADRLAALCREHPYNWFNFHDFWREDEQ
jgi:hypothetical protein